ncbi:uncharacterized protein NECHADRAFT_89007 [Fusarium vanettenii 77-13-4]|uniref:Uncharacterized protein n=1 Tax=Fusarium vanettenii (strain ATCC MYA-4622 / CBS 123669 / FGSC 9596 / NRRL 45880 / 77-13-4) TaxID=660122 RepID=C7ZPW0_FUSV7|nr:uncharacterized protein NECHADRAFT_89007 [Fusarium vanettenii 77-13-4]EEU33948.1 hypothetical protein NECHADRAFT_89007 [Fusarium vanettenii 77-13-4]
MAFPHRLFSWAGHGPAWPREPHVITEIETYRQRVKSFLHNDALHPWVKDITAVESRLRILDLEAGRDGSIATEPASPEETWLYLENALSSSSGRRLILLEGMNPRLAEVLGVKLGIPPEFWLSHWGHTARPRISDSSGSSTYWKDTALVERLIAMRRRSKHITPMWDAIVQTYETEKDISTEDPFLATTIIRNAVGSAWKTKTNDDINRLHVVWTTANDYRFGLNAVNLYQGGEVLIKQSNQTSIEYETLMEERHSIQQHEAQLKEIIRAFRYDSNEFTSSPPDSKLRLLISNEASRWRGTHNQYQWMNTTMAETMTICAEDTAMEEAFTTNMQIIDTYIQTAAVNMQATANQIARSSGQLASIAMVAVPCMVLASIFSMTAGAHLFFVYWCTAIPMTLFLLGWVIQKDVVALVVKMEERLRGSRTDMSSSDMLYLD